MFPNAKPSELVELLAVISPISQGVGTANSGWVPVANFNNLLAVLQTGVMGASATLDAKFQQATDSSGTGAKDITGAAVVQILKAAGDNKQALINLNAQQLDVANNFNFVQLSMTVGTAASLISGAVYGFNPRFLPAPDSQANMAGTVQVVN